MTDTNLMQNAYFAQFFDFMGEAREDYLLFLLGEKWDVFFGQGIGISTVDTSIKYIKNLYLYDSFKIYLWIDKMTSARVFLKFKFIRDTEDEPLAEAKMTICFTRDGGPIRIPELLVERVLETNTHQIKPRR